MLSRENEVEPMWNKYDCFLYDLAFTNLASLVFTNLVMAELAA